MQSLILLIVCGIFSLGLCHEFKKIFLNDVYSLTLMKDQQAEGRRSTIPEIKCIGGSAVKVTYRPNVIEFKKIDNTATPKWECSAKMDNKYKLGKVTVVCEGYDYPGDPYITEGSCGVEYHLDYRPVEDITATITFCLVLAGGFAFMLYIIKQKDNAETDRIYGVGRGRNGILGNRSSTTRNGGTYTSRSVGGTRSR